MTIRTGRRGMRLAVMPTVANGIDLDWNLRRASAQNMEFELRHWLLGRWVGPDRKGVVRVLRFVNHAHMGAYREANNGYLSGVDRATPDITKHERFGAVKYGFGLNAGAGDDGDLRVFTRVGWNEGPHESLCVHGGGSDGGGGRGLLGAGVVQAGGQGGAGVCVERDQAGPPGVSEAGGAGISAGRWHG